MIERGKLLDLGSDLKLRYRYFSRKSMEHPAKLHLGLLVWVVQRYTAPGDTILDPMAGIGSTAYAALLQRNVVLREIEPKWLAFAHENAAIILREAGLFAGAIDIGQGNACQLWGMQADHVIFSPPYQCAMSVTPSAKGMLPHQIRKRLGKVEHNRRIWERMLSGEAPGAQAGFLMHYGQHPAQLGHLRGARYWKAMADVYAQAASAERGRGYMILIIKDHIRHGERVLVADQTVALCETLDFRLVERHARRVWPLSLWQRRRKERGEPIVEEEDVLVFRGAL